MKTPRERKLLVYLALVFGISWVSRGLLATLAAKRILTYGQPGYMILLVVGGVAPASAAYLSTLLTEHRDGLRAGSERRRRRTRRKDQGSVKLDRIYTDLSGIALGDEEG